MLRIDLLLKLSLAVVLGGIIGIERELSGKPAGLRTNILICLGSALLMDLSVRIGMVDGARVGDPARIAAQVVSGIGFLGAGTIMQARGAVLGLTTAATIWVVAAIGLTLVLASVVFGPGSLTLHTLAGSLYGYRLLWVPADRTAARTPCGGARPKPGRKDDADRDGGGRHPVPELVGRGAAAEIADRVCGWFVGRVDPTHQPSPDSEAEPTPLPGPRGEAGRTRP